MEETKHTPGPWRADGNYIESEYGLIIARIHYGDSDKELERAKANVELIRSAPDLLEENKRLKEQNRELVEALEAIRGIDHFISDEQVRNIFRKNVYPAIQKAKGGK